MRAAREMRFTGSVQGVGFRWTVKRIADALDIDGWVRNNPDGSVSLAFEGEEQIADEFMARVYDAMGHSIHEATMKTAAPGQFGGGFAIVR